MTTTTTITVTFEDHEAHEAAVLESFAKGRNITVEGAIKHIVRFMPDPTRLTWTETQLVREILAKGPPHYIHAIKALRVERGIFCSLKEAKALVDALIEDTNRRPSNPL